MIKILKLLGLLILAFLVIIGLGAAYIQLSGIPTYENKAPEDFPVIADSANIAEGARMASMLCANCHRSDDGKLGGDYLSDVAEFGEIWAPNITQHKVYGKINEYTDGELAYLLRTGIKKNGEYSPPYMVKFPHLSDEDLNNIIAFLRSDHPMVQPSDNDPPLCQPSFLTKMLCRVAFGPLPWPTQPIVAPKETDKVAWGKYLALAKYDCYSCHSADFKTLNILEPELSEGFMGGGNRLLNLDGDEVLSSNLTMDKETGLGEWTEEEFIKTVRFGVRPDGRDAIAFPMLPYTRMHDKEVSAIWAYLQSIPVIHNEGLIDDTKVE